MRAPLAAELAAGEPAGAGRAQNRPLVDLEDAGELRGRQHIVLLVGAERGASDLGRAIAAVLDHELAEVLLPGPPRGSVGDHPWRVPKPFVWT